MRKELFDDLLASAKEAVAIHKGQLEPTKITKLAIPDVKAIRIHTGLKQDEFARLMGVSPSLVQAWEQHRRTPAGSSLKLLRMIELKPDLVETLRLT
ncbi:NadS family protein [Xenorhabdus thuongxuanensis]|uniref:Transcriptional regulator n=1 Tax=Xenorhabdus thuongxuanensis TaxID=1873484 RepID=A0A1Q5U646_9GAMM|nr:NadS family protein [Xenorhabdus thuongxuanensis]OKP07944.1 transcriptional regulator [Xenorhabdus thuongxuanensis]